MSREEFIRQFIEAMVEKVGEEDANGYLVRDYAAEVAPAYWDDLDSRECGPEACVEEDLEHWEPAE